MKALKKLLLLFSGLFFIPIAIFAKVNCVGVVNLTDKYIIYSQSPDTEVAYLAGLNTRAVFYDLLNKRERITLRDAESRKILLETELEISTMLVYYIGEDRKPHWTIIPGCPY